MLKKSHEQHIITGRLTRDADTASLTVTHEKNIQNPRFERWMQKVELSDALLLNAVDEMERGLINCTPTQLVGTRGTGFSWFS